MYIHSIQIREFAGLRDFSLELSEGLNLCTGDNESGKSSILAFIRFMLYGLPKRRAGEALSDGDRAFSWDNGVADGSMTVKKDGTVYRIERREMSGSSRKLLQIVNEGTGEILPKGVTPESLLLTFPEEVFDSTVCVRQLRMGELDSDGLSGAIENLILSGDESINTERVLKNLDKARTALLHKNGRGGEIYRAETEISSLRLSLDRMRADIRALRETRAEKETLTRAIRDAERAVKNAEEDYGRIALSETLGRFDALHKEEARLLAERQALDALTASHTYNGFLPDPPYVRTLEAHAEALDESERSILRCEAERDVAAEAQTGDAELLRTAEAVRQAGGKAAVCARLDGYAREKRRAKRLLCASFPIGGGFLLLGVLLALALSNPWLYLLSLGAVISIGGAVGIVRARRARNARRALLSALGLSPTQSPSEIAPLIDRAFREADREAARVSRLQSAEALLVKARTEGAERLRKAESDACRILPMGSVINASVLRSLAARLTREASDRAQASHTLTVREETCRRTRASLAAYDEDALRHRLPVGFDSLSAEASARLTEKLDRAKERHTALLTERLALEGRLSALEATVGSPEALECELAERCAEKARLEERHRAVVLAHESITAAREGLKHRIGPRLREDASRYLSTLSSGRYDSISYDREFALSGEEHGRVRPSAAFSGGTQDAMYLALRLALSDLLSQGGEPLPLLLDEALAQLDDNRAEALLRILLARAEEHRGQVILFTCHSRENEMLKDTNAKRIVL